MLRIERQRAEDRTIIQRYFTRIGIMINRRMQKGLVDIPILQNFELLALLPECFQIQQNEAVDGLLAEHATSVLPIGLIMALMPR